VAGGRRKRSDGRHRQDMEADDGGCGGVADQDRVTRIFGGEGGSDTNRYVDWCKGRQKTVALMKKQEFCCPSLCRRARAALRTGVGQPRTSGFLRRIRLKDGSASALDDQTTPPLRPPGSASSGRGHGDSANASGWAFLVLQHNLALHARDKPSLNLPQIVRLSQGSSVVEWAIERLGGGRRGNPGLRLL